MKRRDLTVGALLVATAALTGCRPETPVAAGDGAPAGSNASAQPSGAGPSGAGPVATGSASGTPSAPATAAPRPSSSTTPAPAPTHPSAAPDRPLRGGQSGPAVLALQRGLVGLGYWLGTPDGRYGTSTVHAVTAFQKVTGLHRDGVAGAATLAALRKATRPHPRSGRGRVAEVDLSRQVLLLTSGGRVTWVMDVSTGRVAGTTPRGHFVITRAIDGYHKSPLGILYRPRYFVGGVAFHGYPSVPAYPASHGCVRVTNAEIDWIWANTALPIGMAVWVY